jgi:hypothetical protein
MYTRVGTISEEAADSVDKLGGRGRIQKRIFRILNWMKQIFIFAIQTFFASFIIFWDILSSFSDSLKTISCPRNFLILSEW